MIASSDFTKLINSSTKEREIYGGNQLIYDKLSHCKCISMIKQIILHVFHDDKNILNQLKKDCPDSTIKNKNLMLNTQDENTLLAL
jgi:hypothetical protein